MLCGRAVAGVGDFFGMREVFRAAAEGFQDPLRAGAKDFQKADEGNSDESNTAANSSHRGPLAVKAPPWSILPFQYRLIARLLQGRGFPPSPEEEVEGVERVERVKKADDPEGFFNKDEKCSLGAFFTSSTPSTPPTPFDPLFTSSG